MSNSEKNFHSNKIQDIKKQMRLDDDEDENVSESEKRDKYNNINIDYSELLSKNGNKINLSGKDLTTEKSKILLNHLTEKYPNITELDINNCNLEQFPKILLNFKKLISFDLRNNNFLDFESLSEDLSNYSNLTDLKIDLTDQNQVLMILSQIPKLIFLNGKSTKEAVTIVDLEEKDIEDISLQKEVETFNEIINKLNDKEEKMKNNNNNNEVDASVSLFSNDFENKLYEEAEKIKNNLNNNLPNYIYANNVIQSQFELKKMLSDKFLSFLNEEDKSIGSLIFNSIFKTGERLVELVNALFPKIEEKTDSLRNQLEEAWKIADEITDFEGKYKNAKKEKEIISSNFKIMEIKMKKLEEENKAITQKLFQMPKELEKKNIDNNITTTINNASNINISEGMNKFQNRNRNSHNNISNITNKDLDKESSKNFLSKNINNSNYSLTNNSIFNKTNETRNDASYINTKPKFLSLKMAKEIMNEIYNSKIFFDRKCYETGKPRETMEQHMYTYLNQKYGLKNLIIDWASSIINAIKLYSSEDCEINLFGKILRNEQDEDSRIILYKLQENISELLEYYLKEKNPLKSQIEIKRMLLQKKNGILTEEEWKGIIYYLYSEEDANNLENKIIRFIQKQREKFNKNNESMHISTVSDLHQTTNPINNYSVNGTSIADFGKTNSSMYLQTHGTKKMTRRDIFNMFKFNEDDNILYVHFINLVGDHQIKSRDKYLKNFVTLFRKYDTDLDGVLNESEFINMIKEISYCQDNIDDYVFRFLSTIDPFNNKKITFNECISLFSMEIIKDNNDNNKYIGQENNNVNNNKDNSTINQMSLLDKICLN